MSFKTGTIGWAQQKRLGPQTEPSIHPIVLIWHIIVGGAMAGYNVFKAQGYTGDESTFILCGPREGAEDGHLWQLQDTRRQADAQFAGNAYANSVETSGMPNEPFSSKMIATSVRLGVQFCQDTGRKPYLVNKTGPLGDGAFGYHELRHDWNTDYHSCPGAIREGQLRQIIIPKIRAELEGGTHVTPKPAPVPAHHPDGKIAVDGIMGTGTIGALQHVLNAGHFDTNGIDGIFGPSTRSALQAYLRKKNYYHSSLDGIFDGLSVRALQTYLLHLGYLDNKGDVDGDWGTMTTKALQKALNAGKF